MEETRIKKELLLEEVGYEKDSIGEVWWSREHLKIKTVWKTQRGCAKRLETWAGSLKVARIMLGTPLETGPCMRQPNISCPLVSYGRLCTQPVLQVLWGTMTLQRKGYQDHWVSPRCTGGGTAEEQKLLLTSHLTHVLQPGLVTVLLCQGGTNVHLPCATRTSHRGSRTVKPATEFPSNPGFHQTFLGP